MTYCTIVARNYLAQARVLARSLARHHPRERLRVLVIDDEFGPVDDEVEPFTVVRPSALALSTQELHHMAAIYEPVELATAVKPRLLRRLLEDDEIVVYLDPDIEIFAPLDAVERLARAAGAVVTPHTLRPIPSDGRKPSQQDIVLAGVFNLGFIAVSRAMVGFLDWWFERLRHDCLVDPARGFFVDQRLVDFLPAWCEPAILREPAYNVAYWNLHERQLERSGDNYTVDGVPLRFFHFSGFDPWRPEILAKHGGDVPRVRPTDNPALDSILRAYAAKVFADGYAAAAETAYGFATATGGERLDGDVRKTYRDALLGIGAWIPPVPPDPFDPANAETFRDWLAASIPPPRPAQARFGELLAAPHWNGGSLPSRAARSLVMRLLEPLRMREDDVSRALLDSINEAEGALRNGVAAHQHAVMTQQVELMHLRSRMDELAARLDELTSMSPRRNGSRAYAQQRDE